MGKIAIIFMFSIFGLIAWGVISVSRKIFITWIKAKIHWVPVTFRELFVMELRKVNSRTIVMAYQKLANAGIEISIKNLEAHYLCGGDVNMIAAVMVKAQKENISLDWDLACAINLLGPINYDNEALNGIDIKILDYFKEYELAA